MSRDGYDNLERSNSDIHQVEVSHGSTSNQTSMYASTSSISESSCIFCCDVINLMLLLASFVFVILFCYDHIPAVSNYFESKHHREKIIVATLTSLFTVVLFIVFVVRCVRRCRGCTCCKCCQLNTETIWYTHKRKVPKDASVLHDENVEQNSDVLPSPKINASSQDINLKLNELHETELRDIKRILSYFKSFHDRNDWSFSSSSQARASQKGVLLPSSQKEVTQNFKVKFTVKVILVGSPNVGKTSVFHRILYDRFSEYYMATLGADLGHSTLHIFPNESDNHLKISLQLWDVAGSERFSDLAHIVYKDATSFILICDVTSPYCVSLAVPWIRDIKEVVFEPHISLLLNKIDLNQKQISLGNQNADFSSLESHPVSAKTGDGVLEAFVDVITNAILHEVDKLLV